MSKWKSVFASDVTITTPENSLYRLAFSAEFVDKAISSVVKMYSQTYFDLIEGTW